MYAVTYIFHFIVIFTLYKHIHKLNINNKIMPFPQHRTPILKPITNFQIYVNPLIAHIFDKTIYSLS